MNREKFKRSRNGYVNGCKNKRRYSTRRQGWDAVVKMMRSPNYVRKGEPHVYACEFCGKFHVGNK